MMKALIIDDEANVRETVSYLLEKYCPQVKVCGMADNFEQGYDLVKQEGPSLLFIDVQLNSPEGTGTDLVNVLHLQKCAVIFISGYKDHAVDAFRLNAVDYLLKPVRISQLMDAVEKAEKFLRMEKMDEQSASADHQSAIFQVPTQNGTLIIRQPEIIRCEADGAYTHFYIEKRKDRITASVNIGQVELSPGSKFLRVHKSHIVSKDHIVSYSKSEGLVIRMIDGSEIPVSRAQRDTFFRWLDPSL